VFTANKITIVGVGLIGGSLALGLRQNAKIGEIVGVSRTEATLKSALSLKVIDRAACDVAAEVAGSDIVVVAVPAQAMDQVFAQIASADCSGTIITDVGSVKGSVIELAKRHFGRDYGNFVAAHPIAGTENSGVAAAFGELFVDRYTIIVAEQATDERAAAVVRTMWESVGSSVRQMDGDEHDAILSCASHLPHLLAFSLVHFIESLSIGQKCFEYAAGGFYDFTRIASSDADMWRDICAMNADNITQHLDEYIGYLAGLSECIRQGRAEDIHQVFSDAKRSRNRWLEKKRS